MERPDLLVILIFLVAAISLAQAQNDEVSWAKRVDTGKEVITTMQFYFHDVLSGRNPSAVRIAQPLQNSSSPLFGSLMMIDDVLTVGPEPSSKEVGRARGMYGSASQDTNFGLIMVLSYVFTDGIYDGSSFSLLSINPAMQPVREMAVVGGTGLFRLARGFAIAQTYSANFATGDAIVGYNVTIATYV